MRDSLCKNFGQSCALAAQRRLQKREQEWGWADSGSIKNPF